MKVRRESVRTRNETGILLKYFLQGLLEEGTVSMTLTYIPSPAHA
jgi:hypothetical protein